MNSISSKVDIFLKTIPDFSCWEKARHWLQQSQEVIHNYEFNLLSPQETFFLDYVEIQEPTEPLFRLFSSQNWRKFVLSTFLADLVSYPKLVDQVDFDRLLFVMHAFPQGFRIWWRKFPNQVWLPVGYTGWYPMLETHFEIFEHHPEKLKDRMVVPYPSSLRNQPYLYLFNYSVIPCLKRSPLTKQLMEKYAQDINTQQARGLACITVSEDGTRVAHRFGMKYSGALNFNGNLERVYVKRSQN